MENTIKIEVSLLKKILPTALVVLFVLGAFSCKTRRAIDSQAPGDTANATAAAEPSPQLTPDFGLYLFDDDEKIVVFPKDYLDMRREEYKNGTDTSTETLALADTGSDDGSFDEDAFLYSETVNLDFMIAKELQNEQTKVSDGLGLVEVPLGTTASVQIKKFIFKANDFIVHVARTLWAGLKYRVRYFKKAVKEKWADKGYAPFNQMKPVETNLPHLLEFNYSVEALNHSKIRLGMLPNEKILGKLTAGSSEDVKVISVVEDFERQFLAKNANLSLRTTSGKEEALLSRAPYKRTFAVGTNSYRVKALNQYSTPDRTMMSEDLTESAIRDVLQSTKENQIVYVHCKSGKGRSASIVVGSRVATILEWAEIRDIKLSTADIDQLIQEQIAQVKGARSEIGISPAQLNNLKLVLYKWKT